MRPSILLVALLPVAAAISSIQCVNKCFTDPILAQLPADDEQLRTLVERAKARDPTLQYEVQRNLTDRDFACSMLGGIVNCLGGCGSQEYSDQQEYFHRQLSALKVLACDKPHLLEHMLNDWKLSLSCYHPQDLQELAIGVLRTLLVEGGDPTLTPDENLCNIVSSVAHVLLSYPGCSYEAKWLVAQLVEVPYRLMAQSIGVSNVTSKCADFTRLIDQRRPLERFLLPREPARPLSKDENNTYCMHECLRANAMNLINTAMRTGNGCRSVEPIVRCWDKCPSNKLKTAASLAYELTCEGLGAKLEGTCPLNHDNFKLSIESNYDLRAFDNFKLRVESNYDLRAFKRIVTSGAKDKLNASENICEIHSAIVDPVVAAFKDYIDAIDNVYAKAQCQRASEIATRVMTLPMRLIALKLGIGQEAHSCGYY